MYRTIKIRLHATKEQKEHLLAYEEVYHTDLQDLIHQLHKHPSALDMRIYAFPTRLRFTVAGCCIRQP